jgi:hypothetical protein
VLDNLAAHRVDGIRQAIAAAGASILYLPRYSPELNPIEQLFAKLKALLRKAAPEPGTSSGPPSAACSPPCLPPNAPATSALAAMRPPKPENALGDAAVLEATSTPARARPGSTMDRSHRVTDVWSSSCTPMRPGPQPLQASLQLLVSYALPWDDPLL